MGRRLKLGQGDSAARKGGAECGGCAEPAHIAGRRRRGDQACNRAPGWPGYSCRPFVRRCRDQRRRQRPESRRPCLCSGVRTGCGRGGRRARQGISAGSRRRRAAAGRRRVPDDDDEGCPGKLCPGSSDGGEKASSRHAGADQRCGLRRETDECGVEDEANVVRGRRQRPDDSPGSRAEVRHDDEGEDHRAPDEPRSNAVSSRGSGEADRRSSEERAVSMKLILAAALLAAAPVASGQELNEAQARAVIAPWYGLFNQPVAAEVVKAVHEQLLSPDYQSCWGVLPGECWGREQSVKVVGNFARSIPDMKFDIKEVLVSGNRVIVRGEVSGTPSGELFGVPHGGRSFRIMAIDIQTIRDGKMVQTYHLENWLSALGQLRAKQP